MFHFPNKKKLLPSICAKDFKNYVRRKTLTISSFIPVSATRAKKDGTKPSLKNA
jgi:hypothetical protein